jgi:predicted outer membrane protein
MKVSKLKWIFLRRFSVSILTLALRMDAQTQPGYPPAMSSEYNPLLWQGDDAQFAVNVLKRSKCLADASETAAAKGHNRAVQDLAITMAHEQRKIYRKLQGMARTIHFPMPRKEELENCPEDSRLMEVSGPEVDRSYIALASKFAEANAKDFEAEASRPQGPGNSSLWKFVQKTLPTIRRELDTVKSVAAKAHQ